MNWLGRQSEDGHTAYIINTNTKEVKELSKFCETEMTKYYKDYKVNGFYNSWASIIF